MDYPKTIVVLGASGGGEVVYWTIKETYPDTRIVFVDDNPSAPFLELGDERLPVFSNWDLSRYRSELNDDSAFRCFLPSSTVPAVKKQLADKALAFGLEPAPALIHPRAAIMGFPTVKLGRGVILHALSLVSIRCVIHDFVHVFPSGIVGHHCDVGKYSAVNCTSMINGYVTIGEGVLLGAGSVVKQHVTIAPWTVVGLQSAVINNVEESGTCIAGVPARPLTPKSHADSDAPGEIH